LPAESDTLSIRGLRSLDVDPRSTCLPYDGDPILAWVKVPTGDAPQLPREIHLLVASLAKRLGRDVASDELFLLALLELPEGAPARSALEAERVTSARALAEVRTAGDKASNASEGLVFPPAYNSLLGRAQAFAATLGDGMITPEHALLALIWDPSSGSSQVLWRLGIERERIVERLASQGVPTPRASIPDQREVEMGKQVWFDRSEVSTVLQTIGRRIEPGTRWGFNYESERAWVWAEAHVDLRSLVDEALPGPRKNGWTRRGPSSRWALPSPSAYACLADPRRSRRLFDGGEVHGC
jgi:hypothetical protein